MLINDRRKNLQKFCHSRVGDVVEIFTDNKSSGFFPVCSAGKLERELKSAGLYDADKPIFLVELSTGIAHPVPYLSSRCVTVVRQACLTIPEDL